jgi:hypothetical protein
MPSEQSLWNKIRQRQAVVPAFAEIDKSRILTPLAWNHPILPMKHYFAIVVDELFLSNSREWHREYDPMVLAITEFVHAGRQVTLPFIVGPKLLGESAQDVPQGMLYRHTRVAGIHPFRGGAVISTIVLCQVRRRDFARQLLKVVESVSGAVPFAGDLSTYTKFAGSLLDGIDSLFEVGETTPLVGIRQEFDHDLGEPIRPGYFVLIDGPEGRFPSDQLWVRDGTLFVGVDLEGLRPLREASYVLFSTRGTPELTQLDTIPQHAIAQAVIDLAASPEEADWKRAKAELLVLFRQLLTSPDLTRDQALIYHQDVVRRAQQAHERSKEIGTLGDGPEDPAEDDLRRAVSLLDLT